MLKCLSAMLGIVVLLLSGCGCGRHPGWKYRGQLHEAIAKADRLVILDAGFDCYGRDSKAKPLFEISDPDEIREFAEHLDSRRGRCLPRAPATAIPASIGIRANNASRPSRSSTARRFAGRGFKPTPS